MWSLTIAPFTVSGGHTNLFNRDHQFVGAYTTSFDEMDDVKQLGLSYKVPLYALGARMLDTCPVVPLGGNLTLGVAILSYDGQLNLGVHADPDACPDLDVFVAGVDRGFAELVAEPVESPI